MRAVTTDRCQAAQAPAIKRSPLWYKDTNYRCMFTWRGGGNQITFTPRGKAICLLNTQKYEWWTFDFLQNPFMAKLSAKIAAFVLSDTSRDNSCWSGWWCLKIKLYLLQQCVSWLWLGLAHMQKLSALSIYWGKKQLKDIKQFTSEMRTGWRVCVCVCVQMFRNYVWPGSTCTLCVSWLGVGVCVCSLA